jgi:membrane protease YdiL (CAAX protease family)
VAPHLFPQGEDRRNISMVMASQGVSMVMACAFVVTEFIVIAFSWLILRLVAGRDWTRQVALRRPSLVHLLFVVAAFPAMSLLSDLVYSELKVLLPDLTMAFLFLALFVIFFLWFLLEQVFGRGWMLRLSLAGQALATIGFALVVFVAAGFLDHQVFLILNRWFPKMMAGPKTHWMEELSKTFSHWPLWFAVLLIGLGPGIGEELWCRGFLGRGLIGQHGVWFGVFFASFFFGLIHIEPYQGAMAVLMGLWLHYTYLMTRSLWVPMLLHFLNNALSVVTSRIHGLEGLEKLPTHLVVSMVILMTMVGYALYLSRAYVAGSGEKITWEQIGAEYPPEGSGLSVVRPAPPWPAVAAVVAGFGYFAWSLMMAIRG